MSGMFEDANRFNQPITKWDVSNVTDMSNMFYNSYDFNKPLKWDTSNVENMKHMFYGAYSFNQTLNTGKLTDTKQAWDVSKVKKVDYMFYGSGFNKPLDKWDVTNVESKESFYSKNQSVKRGPKWVGKIQDKSIRYDISTSLYKLREKYPTLETEHLAKILEQYAVALRNGTKTFQH
jgi:surface protein